MDPLNKFSSKFLLSPTISHEFPHLHRLSGSDYNEVSPCKNGAVSRWYMHTTSCGAGDAPTATVFTDATGTTIITALDASADANPNVRDLDMTAYMAENTGGSSVCTDGSSSGWAVQSAIGSVCYEQIHPDSYNVFDFSYFRCAQSLVICFS